MKLNGSIVGDILVQSSELFSGTDTVGGDCSISSGGTIKLGNSIGTLNILGDLVQSAGSTYYVQINGTGQSSLIDVSGTATLNGSNVVVESLDGNYVANQPYTIFHTDGGVLDTYGVVSTTNLLVTPTFLKQSLALMP